LITKKKDDPNNGIYLNSVSYFLKALLGETEFTHVKHVDIKMDAVMKDDGECFTTKLKDGSIKIRLKVKKGMSFIQTLATLAHESVHAKQFITGELRFTKYNDWVWKGKNYGVDPYKNLTPDDIYTKLPWEKEAYYKENDLVKEYIEYYFESNS